MKTVLECFLKLSVRNNHFSVYVCIYIPIILVFPSYEFRFQFLIQPVHVRDVIIIGWATNLWFFIIKYPKKLSRVL